MENTNEPVIMDTSAVISLLSDSDSCHAQALTISKQLQKQHVVIIVPGEVFSETANALGKRLGHATTSAFCRRLYEDDFHIVETTPDIRSQAFSLFQTQPNSVSYTDCLVMAFADAYSTNTIFGFDSAFRKAGYQLPG